MPLKMVIADWNLTLITRHLYLLPQYHKSLKMPLRPNNGNGPSQITRPAWETSQGPVPSTHPPAPVRQ